MEKQVKIMFKGKKLLDFSRLIEIVDENYIPDGLDISNGVLKIEWIDRKFGRYSKNLEEDLTAFFEGRNEDEYFVLVEYEDGVSVSYGKFKTEEV